MKTEPVMLLSYALPFILVALLAAGARFAIGRPLNWGEMLALFGIVQLPGAIAARQSVTPVTK